MKYTIFIIFFVCSLVVRAQVFEWAISTNPTLEGSFLEKYQHIATDNQGSVINGLSFIGVIDADPGSGIEEFTSHPSNFPWVAGSDICIRKLNAQGELVWAHHFGTISTDFIYDIAVGLDQSIYLLVGVGDGMDFNPDGPGGNVGVGSYLLKLSSNGEYQWSKKLGNYDKKTISIDSGGNILIGGHFLQDTDFDPGPGTFIMGSTELNSFVLKLDAEGVFQWARAIGPASNQLEDLAVDHAGNVYTTGFFSGTVDFDPGPGIDMHTAPVEVPDFYVHKLDAAGNHQWAHGFGGGVYNFSYSIDASLAGDVYISGFFGGVVDFDPGSGNTLSQSEGVIDMFLQKLNTHGGFAWLKQFSSDHTPEDLICRSNGEVYLGGYLIRYEFENGEVTDTYSDVFVYKFNQQGDSLSSGIIGGNGSKQKTRLALGPYNELYISGIWSDTADFDPSANTYLLTETGNSVFITKWNVDLLSISENPFSNIRIYPNPAITGFTVDLKNNYGKVVMEIYDLSGRLISQSVEHGISEIVSDLSEYDPGVYIVRMIIDNKEYSARVVKQ